MNTYKVTATREGKWWMIAVPEIDGLTQARRLSEAADMAREYIAASQGVAIEDVAVDLEVAAVDDIAVAARVAEIAEERKQAADLDRAVGQHSTDLARDLASAKVPLRDIGAILGISYQRAHQLISPRP
ncbi:hypothetical protein J2Y69_003082 [Microbacterium resistens]|uniref:HicB family toxin-antitoxin system n=1 Tax=Microbacterium resistens TaxID=156977 RepID=A0ABU1SFU1_9MICO|nr:hypothetical protein [Microbacterium resistens]MDR6868466.1 hypothetical protein [Microbacterium resistens]